MKALTPVQNEKGLLTLDFIFASVIVFAFSAILFSFAITFSVVEVTQYISFATARNYSLGHLNQEKQKERAQLKYNELIENPALRSLFRNGWFELSEVQIGDFNDEFGAFFDSETFWGARIPLNAGILYKRLPLLGATGEDPGSFTATVQSFLAREPSFEECRDFMQSRTNEMRNINSAFDRTAAVIIMDNGC